MIMKLHHMVAAKCQSLCSVGEKMARVSGKHLYDYALWFKVMRTPVSPELVLTSYNVVVSFCCIW